MPLSSDIKFQKALALAASASNQFEAEAAELAARRLMATFNIDPTEIPDHSLYSRVNFADNALLKRLREEWHEAHPVADVEQKVTQTDLKGIPAIPFNIGGFRKTLKRNRKYSRSSEPRNEARIEKLRQLLNSGKPRAAICTEDGFKQGEISGIIRDYTGAKSAHQRFQDNPKWVAVAEGGRTIYNLSGVTDEASDGEPNSPEVINGAGLTRSQQDAETDGQRGEAGAAVPPGA